MLIAWVMACGVAADLPPPDGTDRCAVDEVQDGDTCVPAACGTGPWGTVTGADVYVDAGADGDGDGSEDAPLRSIQDAIQAAGGGVIAVAAGAYDEPLDLGDGNEGIRVLGRCRELVTLDGSDGDEDEPAVYLEAGRSGGEWELSGVTITGGQYAGVIVASRGTLTLDRVRITDNSTGGIVASGSQVTVNLTDSEVSATKYQRGDAGSAGVYALGSTVTMTQSTISGNDATGLVAWGSGTLVTLTEVEVLDSSLPSASVDGGGLVVGDGAALSASDSVIRGNAPVGVFALDAGTEVWLERTEVSESATDLGGQGGTGIAVQGGAAVTATECAIRGNHEAGVAAQQAGSLVTLLRTSVTDTQTTAEGFEGVGVAVGSGAGIAASDCQIEGNHAYGASVEGEGSWMTLEGTSVSRNLPEADGLQGAGIVVADGGSLTATDCSVAENHTWGVYVSDEGSSAILERVVILDTLPDVRPDSGRGLTVQLGAVVTATDCTIQGNHTVGVFVDGESSWLLLDDTDVLDTLPDADGNRGRGVDAQNGATVELVSCSVERNHESGVLVDTSTMILTDTAILDTLRDWASEAAIGLTAQEGADVVATGVTVSGTEGPGLDVMLGSTLDCVSCTLTRNEFAGAMLHGGTLRLHESVVSDNLASPVEGGGVGIFAFQDPNSVVDTRILDLSGTAVGEHPYAAVWLAAPGDYQIADSTLAGSAGVPLSDWLSIHGNAVYATDAEVAVRNTVFTGWGVATVLLEAGGAQLSGNTWTGVTDGDASWDIVQQFCGDEPPLASADGAPYARLCTADAELMVQDLSFAIYFDEAQAN